MNNVPNVEMSHRVQQYNQLSPNPHAPDVIGSVLGLIGPVSVYCDWVRWKV